MGSEKAQEKKLDVAEMMSRWMCGVARLERIRNEINIGVMKVEEIFNKVQKRLTGYGHVMRRGICG